VQKNRHREITLEIRKRILSGKFRPEEQLPTRVELEQEFNVSCVTMQRAIVSLVDDGTLYTKGKHGTFVSKFPREIYHYGILFYQKPDNSAGQWLRHWKVILHETENLFTKAPYSLSVFYGDRNQLNANGNAGFMEDIRNKRMAGLILAMTPDYFEGTEIIGDSDTPKVTTSAGPDCQLPSISFDSMNIGKMAEYLSGRKRSKTAIVVSSRQLYAPSYLDEVVKKLKSHGLETHDFWILGADIFFPKSIVSAATLMMRDKNFRPDSIIVLDDNLLPGVIEGLQAGSACVPRDVELVAMVNFPYDEKLDVPVKLFGFDISELVRLTKIKLDAIRQNLKYEKSTKVKFISDTEYARKRKD